MEKPFVGVFLKLYVIPLTPLRRARLNARNVMIRSCDLIFQYALLDSDLTWKARCTLATRWRIGGWLWIASALQLLVQVAVANVWPDGYSIAHNTISDLGVTTCGLYDEAGIQSRMVCSPRYELFNASLVVMGALLVVGSVLLWDAWPRRRTGNAGLVLVVLGGLGVAGVGLTPSDLFGALHGPAAFLQAAFQWFAMLVFAFAVPVGAPASWRAIRAVSLVLFVTSILGFTLFLLGSDGVVVLGIGWGIAERIAFDTLTLWSAAIGVLLLRAFHRPLPARQQVKESVNLP